MTHTSPNLQSYLERLDRGLALLSFLAQWKDSRSRELEDMIGGELQYVNEAARRHGLIRFYDHIGGIVIGDHLISPKVQDWHMFHKLIDGWSIILLVRHEGLDLIQRYKPESEEVVKRLRLLRSLAPDSERSFDPGYIRRNFILFSYEEMFRRRTPER